jgi:dolichyl-diphosphooligosaccharide--protein glycosyltransferase
LSSEIEAYLRKHGRALALLVTLFALALFLRVYFVYDLALPEGLVSGGSDAFYYDRIMGHILRTGEHLTFDPLLNYPIGMRNPRPPLFAWTNVLGGVAFSPLFADVQGAVTFVFLASTAVWGALTIFPTYLLAKRAFGRRAGLIAAFFLAVMPAHLQRSVMTNGDHDAMVLFFVVTAFYFFLRSLEELKERRWVERWNLGRPAGWTEAGRGVGRFFGENRVAVLYAVLAGLSVATVALTWQGWAYAVVILLVYFVVQLFVHRFRNQDPLGVTLLFAVAVGTALLLAFPYYQMLGFIRVWYDVPAYLFLAAFAFGMVFAVTRDLPWALVVPSVAVGAAVAFAALYVVNPAVSDAFVSGAGYFVRTKVYETIAEAQPPGLSQVILSFGATTYYLSLFALAWMVIQIPKRPRPDFLFLVVWSVASIFMALAAARFIFNASPAFAVTSAYVTNLVLDRLKFDEMKATFAAVPGRRFAALRRAVSLRHVLGTLLIVLLLLVPNVWFGVDASIPFERKVEFDRQVGEATPAFLQPANYEQIRDAGGTFYFGAFGYSLPLPRRYFPAAWEWLAQQDREIQNPRDRPAFLSWWDYGFEAIDETGHPTVADNFQNGFQLAGNFITAQDENEAIALLSIRLVEGDFFREGRQLRPEVRATLEAFGLPATSVEDAIARPAAYVPVVQADPARFGRYDPRLQAANAKYIFLSTLFTEILDTARQADLYRAVRGLTGDEIRYFLVDTRLFPYDPPGAAPPQSGIFYAPAKLSDQRVVETADGRVIPIDFFKLRARTGQGDFDLDKVPPTATVTEVFLEYGEMFYNSMFYRAYVGFPPSAVGQTCTDCIPGFAGALANQDALPGWGLEHFRLVYRTAYFNPFTDFQDHPDDTRAINYFDALEIQQAIDRGEREGTVFLSTSDAIQNGLVILKYYDGAYVNGTVALEGAGPVAGVNVTIVDEFGVPHTTATTDAEGRFSALAPFGQVRVVVSTGPRNGRTLVGPTVLSETTVTITEAQAMRRPEDADGDGVLDYLVRHDVVLSPAEVRGRLYLDLDGSRTFDADVDRPMAGEVRFAHADAPLAVTAVTGGDGAYELTGLLPGTYAVSASDGLRTFGLPTQTLAAGPNAKDLNVTTSLLEGLVRDARGTPQAGARVELLDQTNGTVIVATTNEDGRYAIADLLPGPFVLSARNGSLASPPINLVLRGEGRAERNVVVVPSGTVGGTVTRGGVPVPFARVVFVRPATGNTTVALADEDGRFAVTLAEGVYLTSVRRFEGSALYVHLGQVEVVAGEDLAFDPLLGPGVEVRGVVRPPEGVSEAFPRIVFAGSAGTAVAVAGPNGTYVVHLVPGTYRVSVSAGDFAFAATRSFLASQTFDIEGTATTPLAGYVYRDVDGDGVRAPREGLGGIRLVVDDDEGRRYDLFTTSDGRFVFGYEANRTYTIRIRHPGYEPLDFGPVTGGDLRDRSEFALLPLPVRLAGTLLVEGVPLALSNVTVGFVAADAAARNVTTATDAEGRYVVDLVPGRYDVVVDAPQTPGQDDVRYQNRDATTVEARVGAGSLEVDVPVVLRARVAGEMVVDGVPVEGVIAWDGPEQRTLSVTNGTYALFLAFGNYSVVANATKGNVPYLALEVVAVAGPTTLDLDMARAVSVSGLVGTGERVVTAPLTVVFERADGLRLGAESDGQGRFALPLLPGQYNATVDGLGKEEIDGALRYFRYAGNVSVDIPDGTTSFRLSMEVDAVLDNRTVGGRATFGGLGLAADIRFVARGPEGMNATFESAANGTYAASLQPGSYDVYAVSEGQGAVLLARLVVPSEGDVERDLPLVAGTRVSGVVTDGDGDSVAAALSLEGSTGRVDVASDAAGRFAVLLPPGTYWVNGTATAEEQGIQVTYRGTSLVDAAGATTLANLRLDRVVVRGLRLDWDPDQTATIPAGGTVTYVVTVRNEGNVRETVRFSGTPGAWTFAFSPSTLTLDFGAGGNVSTVTVRITAPADALVDHPPVVLAAQSVDDAATRTTREVDVAIVPSFGLALVPGEEPAEFDGRYTNATVVLRNEGNARGSFTVTVLNGPNLLASGWDARFAPASGGEPVDVLTGFVVDANETRTFLLVVENRGGSGGAAVILRAFLEEDPRVEQLAEVSLELPLLLPEGTVGVTGPRVERVEPFDPVPWLFAVGAGALGVAFLVLRRRRRGRRRR